ncbi:MAG TPA: hypothetical protein VIF14_14325 [Alphaproteobacteria bacterium]|jgi:chromosome segregation ATPase
MTTDTQIRDCENEVAQFRRNIGDLQSRREELQCRIAGLRRAIEEIEDRKDTPGFRLRMLELQAEILAVEKELETTRPELEFFRGRLHEAEQKCWELRRQQDIRAPTENDLRKAIDDPRYWRHGDPVLAKFVTDGFKRLYPDESDE